MAKKAEYKSAIRSRKLIRQAFVNLIEKKEFKKITVTDIITYADINRGTFYSHYQDIQALAEEIENEVIEKILEFLGEFHYKNFFQNPVTLLSKIAVWLEEDLEFYRILINTNCSEQFLVKLKDIFVKYMETDSDIPEHIKKTKEFYINAHFFAGGLINLVQVCFRGEFDSSLNEICQQVSKIIVNNSDLFRD